MNDLMIFSNPEFGEIRTIEENGSVLFCGKDVASALGYKVPKDAISAHCKGAVKHRLPTASGVQEMSFIPEPDLYRLIFRSKVPGAERFTDWVTEDVLPSIRKHGQYIPNQDSRKELRIEAAKLLVKIAERYMGTSYEQVLHANATKELTGEFLLPLPRLEAQTYSAGEIGARLGISGKKVGSLVKQNNLKTDQYGEWFKDKSPFSNKEVSTFRYYESIIPMLEALLTAESA